MAEVESLGAGTRVEEYNGRSSEVRKLTAWEHLHLLVILCALEPEDVLEPQVRFWHCRSSRQVGIRVPALQNMRADRVGQEVRILTLAGSCSARGGRSLLLHCRG